MYSSTLSLTSALNWGGGGQRYTPAALPPGKTQYPLYRRLGGPPGPTWMDAENLAPTGIQSTGRPAPQPVAIPTELSRPTLAWYTCTKFYGYVLPKIYSEYEGSRFLQNVCMYVSNYAMFHSRMPYLKYLTLQKIKNTFQLEIQISLSSGTQCPMTWTQLQPKCHDTFSSCYSTMR